MSRVARAPETSLYGLVKTYLEAQGFAVKGEVCGCDLVAVRDEIGGQHAGETTRLLVVAELKMAFSLELVLQGVDRLRAADQVWLAVAQTRRGRDTDRRALRLCRLIGFGLMAVNTTSGRVEILAEPETYKPRSDKKRRARLLREHTARRGDPTQGGSTRAPIMTAYRQQALACAAAMRAGPARPRDLAALGADVGPMLRRNVYGWFERVERGLYRLTEGGHAALQRWPPETPV